ncbi:MAG TPA: DNA-binding domain-containing protein [Candidatus Binatia bacterium]|jgi:hypothetical protein
MSHAPSARPPALRALQQAFYGALASGAAGTTVGDPALLAVVQGTEALDPTARLDVYAQMYWMRIADALREDFPRLATIVGEHAFHDLVRAYLGVAPSRHPSLSHAGARFGDFLAPRSDVPAFAADLARLEWARARVFTAADADVLTLDALRTVPPEAWPALRLRAIPASALLDLAWPAHQVWASEDEPPATDPAALRPLRTALRVWRDGTRVYQTPVAPAERAALELLRGGATFAEICTAVGGVRGEAAAAEETAALLLRWVADRFLAAR